MGDVTYSLHENSQTKIVLEVKGAPDTTSENLPGAPTIRPDAVALLAWPDEDGLWYVSTVQVGGPKVQKNGEVTKRRYDVPFMSPLDEDSKTPEWLRKIVVEWTTQINGGGPAAPEKAPQDDEDSPIPGTLFAYRRREQHVLKDLDTFSVQYNLGTTIDLEWDDKAGELAVDTPADFWSLVVRPRSDGRLGLRVASNPEKR